MLLLLLHVFQGMSFNNILLLFVAAAAAAVATAEGVAIVIPIGCPSIHPNALYPYYPPLPYPFYS